MTVALWFARDSIPDEDAGNRRHKPSAPSPDANSAFPVPASATPPSCFEARSQTFVRDTALLARIRTGDVDALMELMRHYLAQLTTIVVPVLGSADTAQDVIQDVFVAFWDHRETLDSDLNVRDVHIRDHIAPADRIGPVRPQGRPAVGEMLRRQRAVGRGKNLYALHVAATPSCAPCTRRT